MSMYQALYNKAKQELEQLEEKLKELETKKKETHEDFNKVSDKLEERNKEKSDLELEKSTLFDKKNKSIDKFITNLCFILSVLVFMIGVKITGNMVLGIDFISAVSIAFSTLITVGTIFGISYVLMEISLFLKKNAFNKITNSDEYKQLSIRISKLEEEIKSLNVEVGDKKKILENVTKEYNDCKKERDEKKTLVEYICKQINPVETTLSLNRELKPNSDSSNKTED